ILRVYAACGVLFFFSSRRRHTRSLRDWSSDVCSSDLKQFTAHANAEDVEHRLYRGQQWNFGQFDQALLSTRPIYKLSFDGETIRSEERRVGKECISRRSEAQ